MAPFKPREIVTLYQIGELFGKYKLPATGATAANGCRATGLFPFNMHFFRSCAKYFRLVHTLYARMEEILLASLVKNKHFFFKQFIACTITR
jgi:hypothetical protein